MRSTKNIKWKPTKNNIILKDEKAITIITNNHNNYIIIVSRNINNDS